MRFLQPSGFSIIRTIMCVYAATLVVSLTCAADQPSSNEIPQIVVKRDASYDELPLTVRRRPSPALSEKELRDFTSVLPSLVLDGVVLDITSPQVGSTQTLSVGRLELRQGARLVTHGVNLEINAALITSDASSKIVAFPARRGDSVASPGSNGSSGFDAGTLIISGEIKQNDTLQVQLDGEPGQAGRVGLQGGGGAPGTRGDNAAGHLFDCAHGGGNGGDGGQGGIGGQGGRGRGRRCWRTTDFAWRHCVSEAADCFQRTWRSRRCRRSWRWWRSGRPRRCRRKRVDLLRGRVWRQQWPVRATGATGSQGESGHEGSSPPTKCPREHQVLWGG